MAAISISVTTNPGDSAKSSRIVPPIIRDGQGISGNTILRYARSATTAESGRKQPNSDTRHMNTISVLIPVYNEENTLARIVKKVLMLGDLITEVIIVDDGSADSSLEVAHALAKEDPKVSVISTGANSGKTAAISRGLKIATGHVIIIQDADLEYDPAEIPAVVEPILSGVADVVYGSRFLVRRASRVLYFYHYLANKTLTFLSNLLTNRNMTDIETCYKAFRREVIVPLELTSKGFGLEVEITAMISKTSARTYEVPISYYGRTYGEGKKIGVRDGLAALYYIAFYNLIRPRLRGGRSYIASVNASLRASA